MTRYPLRPHLKVLIYAMLPVAVKKYNYSVQICYTISPMHLGSPSQTGAIHPNFNQISILATGQYHAICDCYGCLSSISSIPSSPCVRTLTKNGTQHEMSTETW